MRDSSKLAAAAKLEENKVKLKGELNSALSFPNPWHLRRGPVGRQSTRGCHGLIQQAAKRNTAAASLPSQRDGGENWGQKSKICELTVL